MGNEFFYRDYDHELESMTKGKWRQVRRVLRLFIEYVNEITQADWSENTFFNVAVSEKRTEPPLQIASTGPEIKKPFDFDMLFRDEADSTDEVYVENLDELARLFEWASFLEQRDGAFRMYKETISELQRSVWGYERYLDI